MSKILKRRCPNCDTINEIEVEQELIKGKKSVKRAGAMQKMAKPKYIIVVCTNCGQTFKVMT